MSRKYTKIDQYEKQILSILIVRAKPEQKVYLQRLRKIFLQLFTFAHPVVFIGRDRISIRSLQQGTSTQGFARLQGHPSHLLGPLGGSIRQQQFSLPRTQPFFRFFQKKQCRQSAGREAWQRIPSIVTVRTFFIGKPSFGGFGKFSPKTKKARSSFCSERTASERAMYGEKCFARLPAERWKIDSHRLSCIYMDLQESVYQSQQRARKQGSKGAL